MTFRVSSAHEEGGERVYAVSTQEFLGDEDGNVRALRLVEVDFEGGKLTEIEGTEREIPAELVLLRDGLRRSGEAGPGRAARRRARRARQRRARRVVRRPRCRASSSPATPVAASR